VCINNTLLVCTSLMRHCVCPKKVWCVCTLYVDYAEKYEKIDSSAGKRMYSLCTILKNKFLYTFVNRQIKQYYAYCTSEIIKIQEFIWMQFFFCKTVSQQGFNVSTNCLCHWICRENLRRCSRQFDNHLPNRFLIIPAEPMLDANNFFIAFF